MPDRRHELLLGSCPCGAWHAADSECRDLPSRRLRVLSLFAGIGGLDLGLEAHGCTTVAYSEVDPYACRVMARHFPDAINLGDITTIDWETVRELDIDIICGGFPCQDISLAGKGAGIADGTRSGLWIHYADAIRILRPRGVLVENVAALSARGLDRVLGDLAACGFDAEWDCVPAFAVGAPHRRDRMFVLAYPDRGRCGERGERYGWPRARLHAQQWNDAGGLGAAEHAVAICAAEAERMAHGIPQRVAQLRCLGNAVVPQVAEHVAGILIDRMEAA